ncbi:MAG: class I adenylate-forming enzyme family protein [bacterium]|nr:class I adenylate-forming enzyme family protein [bacterium]MDE0290269.1 class I adenylate-forming enzyme family protein [bacterium]MDE0438768.1 class I adenylate-forming enzyme family protein [bacterium]
MTSPLRQHRSPAGFRWPRRTLWDDVARHAVEHPGATAVSDGDGGYTYRGLVDSTLLLSGRYRQMGVRHGDVVIVQMHGVRQFVPAFLAAERLGAVVSPILPAIDGKAFGEIVDLACPALVVTANDPDTLEGTGVTPVVSAAPSGPGPRLDALLDGRCPGRGLPDPPAPHDLSELAFTSGTTDRPKGVLHTHATATAGILSTISRQGIEASDVVHVALPVGHNFGYFYGVRLGLHAGAHVVLQARWNPDRMLEACARYGVTVSSGPPAFLVDLLGCRSKWRGRLDSLRLFTCAGAKLALDTAREVVDKLPGRMSKAFGMTELGHVCSTTAGAPTDKLLETEGHPHPEIQMRVLGTGGEWLGREQEGEIAFRGPFLMFGYHGGGSPEAIDEDGFFRTGDLGYTDRDGYLVITGRVKNMVIRGGENIPAERVERALAGHELLRDAAVVGVPDRRLGERPVACVQARPGFVPRTADLAEFLQRAGIPPIHCPEAVVVVEEIPRGPTGKVRRAHLRGLASGVAAFEQGGCDG